MAKVAALCFLMFAFPTYGQLSDEKQVIAAIDQLFAGMRAGDSSQVQQVFAPQARLCSVSEAAEVHEISLIQFLTAVGTPHDDVWDERLTEYDMKIDGTLATAWTPYSFYRGEEFSHCGVNAFHLVKSPTGWKILQITDTRRQSECVE